MTAILSSLYLGFSMIIFKVEHVTDELLAAFENLVPQLTSSNPPPGRGELIDLVKSGLSTLLAVRYPDENGFIVGALCLTVYRVPTGIRAIIEDFVVDGAVRGLGVGGGVLCRAP